MTNKDLDILKNKKAEQEFFDMAAREIDKELDQVFIEAQNLPDPDPEILQRIQKNLNAEMYKQTVAWYIKKWASGIGKVLHCSLRPGKRSFLLPAHICRSNPYRNGCDKSAHVFRERKSCRIYLRIV